MRAAYDFLREAAETNRTKAEEYGDNYKQIGRVLAALFPSGITLETEDDFNRFHLLLLKLVKTSRYVMNWEKGGHEDSLLDDVVYGGMLLEIDEEIREERLAASEALDQYVDPRDPPVDLQNMFTVDLSKISEEAQRELFKAAGIHHYTTGRIIKPSDPLDSEGGMIHSSFPFTPQTGE